MLYIDRELVLHHFEGLPEIKTTMISKASGVFLWVILVVKRLRTAWDKGYQPSQIRRILEELPPKLEDLYSHITDSMTKVQLNTSSRIAQFVLSSKEPPSANDVHYILALTDEQSECSLMEIASTAPINAQKLQRFRSFLTEITGGLFEISTASSTNIVQVIHETVRGFLHRLGGFSDGTTRPILSLAMEKYALSVEVRGAFGQADRKTTDITSWIRFCERSPPEQLYLMSQAVPEHLVVHGLACIEPVRITAEGWLFAFGLMKFISADKEDPDEQFTTDDYETSRVRKFMPLAVEILEFLTTHKRVLGLSRLTRQD
jgi:hypothetical protein